MKVLLFDPSAGASGDMIMASLLDLGADLDAVRSAVESVGCGLEVSRKEKSHIMACRARVISDRRYQSLDEAKSILQSSSLSGKALEDAMAALDTLAEAEGRVHGVAAQHVRFHEIGALDALADMPEPARRDRAWLSSAFCPGPFPWAAATRRRRTACLPCLGRLHWKSCDLMKYPGKEGR
jgi:hypothetical protein